MKVLMMDTMGVCGEVLYRAQEAGHEVKYYAQHTRPLQKSSRWKGYMPLTDNWEAHMDWADLVIVTDNEPFKHKLSSYFKAGYPIMGCNMDALELESNRDFGQKVLQSVGVDTLPYEVFEDFDRAIAFVKRTQRTYAVKPWGEVEDKALSFVPKTLRGLYYHLDKMKQNGALKGAKFMLQDTADGIEMAVGAWFGPGGFSRWKLENFEEKKFMNDGLGQNTGEQGTILRYVEKSQLFDEVLAPVEPVLSAMNYVGYVDMNCIIDTKLGKAWPLEFTTRFGWPLILIQQALHVGDPVQWMLDLVQGSDTLRVRDKVCVGVVVTHGDYPHCKAAPDASSHIPLYGLDALNRNDICLCEVMQGVAPNEKLRAEELAVTAGTHIAVVNGTGASVEEARKDCYKSAAKLKEMPTNVMYRTDIGKRLEAQLPLLRKWGYAKGLVYGK